MVYGSTAHNKRYTRLSALRTGRRLRQQVGDGLQPAGLEGSGFARSVASLVPTQHSTHIFAVAGTLRVPLSQPQKRHIQPKR
jgi:hypothetical protein